MRKKKDKRMRRKFHVIIEKDEDGYFVGLVPELPGCHTQAKSLDTLQERLKEAIRLYLEVETGIPENLQFVGIQQIEVSL
jgi:predicted RNase H-like HicB family nuclease